MRNDEELCLGIRKPHVGMFDWLVSDYVRERMAAETERDAAWDEQDRLDYSKLAIDLCHSEDQLQEAAECVRLLIAWAREDMRCHDAETLIEEAAAIRAKSAAWGALPAWLQRDIEKG